MPAIVGGKVQKFLFKEDEMVRVFDLNNLHSECKKDKKCQAKMKQQQLEQEQKEEEAEQQESKKDK